MTSFKAPRWDLSDADDELDIKTHERLCITFLHRQPGFPTRYARNTTYVIGCLVAPGKSVRRTAIRSPLVDLVRFYNFVVIKSMKHWKQHNDTKYKVRRRYECTKSVGQAVRSQTSSSSTAHTPHEYDPTAQTRGPPYTYKTQT